MTSAKRLKILFEERTKGKTYIDAIKQITGETSKFKNLTFIKYFIKDVQKIEQVAKERGNFTKNVEEKLTNILYFLSPACDANLTTLHQIIVDLEMFDMALEPELNYSDELEKLKIELKELKSDNPLLSQILQDIKEVTEYYSFFGNAIVEDKFYKVSTEIYGYAPKSKEIPKEIAKVIQNFLDFAITVTSKGAKITSNLIQIRENVVKLITYNKEESE